MSDFEDDRDMLALEFSEEFVFLEDREEWARRYDELNGAPEGEWDR